MNLGKHCTYAGLRVADRPTGDRRQTAEDQAGMGGLGIELLQMDHSYPYQWVLEDAETVLRHLDKYQTLSILSVS